MKEHPQYDLIDQKFIKSVDEILKINKELGIKPSNDSSLGFMIYPTNRSIISSVRSRAKHIPHLALMNLAKKFNVNMNYFYSEGIPLAYQPPVLKNITVNGNGIQSTGDNTTNIHAGEGNIKGINTAEAGSNNTLIEVIEVSTMINNFISKMDSEHIQQFLKIISKIQTESKSAAKKMTKLLEEKSTEIKQVRASFEIEMKSLRNELKETRDKLDNALKSEVELLRQLLEAKK